MHYCFLTIGPIYAASYIRARELGRALLERGVDVSYVVVDTPENRAAKDVDPRARVVWVADQMLPAQTLARRRALRGLGPDFVEVLNPHPKTLLALAGMRGPRVVAMWDEPYVLRDLGALRNFIERVSHRWLLRRAHVRLTATRRFQQILREQWNTQAYYFPHATYMPPYADGDSPYPRRTIVYMGSFYPLWDQDLLFDALDLLAHRGVKPPVAMIGSGPDLEKWHEFVRQRGLDNVQFTGFLSVEAMWRGLRHADVLLFPIRPTLINETRCPSKTLAYAQARRPVITNRVGEVAEMLGEKATYVPATPEGFACAIEAVVKTPRPPDMDYGTQKHTWALRAEAFHRALLEGGVAGFDLEPVL